MKSKNVILTVMALMAMTACSEKAPKGDDMGIKLENLDQTAVPGDDFFQFACGGWMKNNPLTDEYSRFGSFDMLAENNREQLKGLIDEIVSTQHEKGSNAQKIADLYNLVMDTVRRNNDGIEPIRPYIDRIEAISSQEQVFPTMVALEYDGMASGYFGVGIGADMMDSKMNIVGVGQGGLSLGEKEYYVDNDEATTAIREAFKKHIVRMFKLYGFDEETATGKMESVMKIETLIADKSYNGVQQRDPAANYHKMPYAQFLEDYKGIDWNLYFKTMGMEGIEEIDVNQPEPIHEVERILAEVPFEDHKAYMEWQVIDGSASQLTQEFDQANFDFYGTVMSGKKEQQPMWKRATSTVSGVLGEAIGQLYTEKYFPASSKARMEELVRNLQTALAQRIDEQDWMSDSTKARAHEKLDAFHVKIGYPDKWRDYSRMEIDPSKNMVENMIEISHFMLADAIERKLGKPVDNTEWFMTPQTVNAYYNPTTNEICFPAGILQYPFFDMNADDAFNYGAIGVVIGHEMTHGFDDQGRQFDKDGNMNDWWAEGDADRFNEHVKVIADHFSAIEVLPGLKANGELCLGENIADHGGLMVAYQAFRNATKDNPLPDKEGYTPEQRFFMAYAGVWAGNIRDEEIRNRTKSDVHSLSRWRVNGTLPHIDAWYDAFGVTEDNSLYLPVEKRAAIW